MSAERPIDGGTALLKSRITRYFNECRSKDLPATPSGLALALKTRTEELTRGKLPDAQRRLIDEALQRIETETLERALNGKNSAKGIEVVLQQTTQPLGTANELKALTDDELQNRLKAIARELNALIGGGEGDGD